MFCSSVTLAENVLFWECHAISHCMGLGHASCRGFGKANPKLQLPYRLHPVCVLWHDCYSVRLDSVQVGSSIMMSVGAMVTHLATICDWWWSASSFLSPAPSSSAGGQALHELLLLLCTDTFMIVFIVSCNLVIISYCAK